MEQEPNGFSVNTARKTQVALLGGSAMPNRGGSSWKRAAIVTKVKQQIYKNTGIALTKMGQQREVDNFVKNNYFRLNGILILIVMAILLLLTACSSTPKATPTEVPTVTIEPTKTPTSTPTSSPTFTPSPTMTPTLTPTPVGGSLGKIVFERISNYQSEDQIANLFLLDLGTMMETQLTDASDSFTDYYYPAISPDGLRIAYSKNSNNGYKSELFIMDMDGSNVKKVSPAPLYQGNTDIGDYLNDIQVTWAPDGKKLAFASNRHSIAGYLYGNKPDLEIYEIDLTTFEVKQLTNGYGESYHPWYSPDGSKITYMSNRDGSWQIYVMDADGKNVQRLTNGPSSTRFPKWSNNGASIVFHSDRDGNVELYLYDLLEKTTKRITTDPSDNSSGSFSPDSQWILYQSDTTGNYNLYIMNIGTNEVIQITDEETAEMVADWSR